MIELYMKRLKWTIGAHNIYQLIMINEGGDIKRYHPVIKGGTLKRAIVFLLYHGNIPILKQLFKGEIIYKDN